KRRQKRQILKRGLAYHSSLDDDDTADLLMSGMASGKESKEGLGPSKGTTIKSLTGESVLPKQSGNSKDKILKFHSSNRILAEDFSCKTPPLQAYEPSNININVGSIVNKDILTSPISLTDEISVIPRNIVLDSPKFIKGIVKDRKDSNNSALGLLISSKKQTTSSLSSHSQGIELGSVAKRHSNVLSRLGAIARARQEEAEEEKAKVREEERREEEGKEEEAICYEDINDYSPFGKSSVCSVGKNKQQSERILESEDIKKKDHDTKSKFLSQFVKRVVEEDTKKENDRLGIKSQHSTIPASRPSLSSLRSQHIDEAKGKCDVKDSDIERSNKENICDDRHFDPHAKIYSPPLDMEIIEVNSGIGEYEYHDKIANEGIDEHGMGFDGFDGGGFGDSFGQDDIVRLHYGCVDEEEEEEEEQGGKEDSCSPRGMNGDEKVHVDDGFMFNPLSALTPQKQQQLDRSRGSHSFSPHQEGREEGEAGRESEKKWDGAHEKEGEEERAPISIQQQRSQHSSHNTALPLSLSSNRSITNGTISIRSSSTQPIQAPGKLRSYHTTIVSQDEPLNLDQKDSRRVPMSEIIEIHSQPVIGKKASATGRRRKEIERTKDGEKEEEEEELPTRDKDQIFTVSSQRSNNPFRQVSTKDTGMSIISRPIIPLPMIDFNSQRSQALSQGAGFDGVARSVTIDVARILHPSIGVFPERWNFKQLMHVYKIITPLRSKRQVARPLAEVIIQEHFKKHTILPPFPPSLTLAYWQKCTVTELLKLSEVLRAIIVEEEDLWVKIKRQVARPLAEVIIQEHFKKHTILPPFPPSLTLAYWQKCTVTELLKLSEVLRAIIVEEEDLWVKMLCYIPVNLDEIMLRIKERVRVEKVKEEQKRKGRKEKRKKEKKEKKKKAKGSDDTLGSIITTRLQTSQNEGLSQEYIHSQHDTRHSRDSTSSSSSSSSVLISLKNLHKLSVSFVQFYLRQNGVSFQKKSQSFHSDAATARRSQKSQENLRESIEADRKKMERRMKKRRQKKGEYQEVMDVDAASPNQLTLDRFNR
ncbi:hypothetical protein ADUPG1_011564, partial [Aduncisulcus paluster]